MSRHNISNWQHPHVFDTGNQVAERSAKTVMWITLAMMVIEIGAGWWYNSMALLADGWHMSSHALALGLSAFAYTAARTYAHDTRFAFGTWKIEILAGYTSAILLICVAGLMVFSSIERLIQPQPIHYSEAMLVATLGLVVNLVCAFILGGAHHHGHSHHAHSHADHQHSEASTHHHHSTEHQDLNLKAAYIHVITDAATSILALIALAGGWLYGWNWLDPLMGILGALLILAWAKNLTLDTGKILLDREMDHPLINEIQTSIETEFTHTQISDLHVWRVGTAAYSVTLAVVTHNLEITPDAIKQFLSTHTEIAHITVEVNQCQCNQYA